MQVALMVGRERVQLLKTIDLWRPFGLREFERRGSNRWSHLSINEIGTAPRLAHLYRIVVQVNRIPKRTARGFRSAAR